MARKIPNRSGTAISNEDRLARSRQFTTSATKYAAFNQSTAAAVATEGPAANSVDKKEPRKGEKAALAETARINPGVSTQPLADDACSNSTEAQSRTYYVRIGAEGQARIDALAERSDLDPDYVRRALIKAVRARMQNLRDTATWHEIASAARPRLAEVKGTGAPFMKSMIRLDAAHAAALQTSIDDPLNVYGVTQLLSAFGKALLRSEIEELAQKISGIEARAARPDPA
ncbi:hypothetical protein PVW51_16745 [Sulfitobacter sp. PR48]|uniref:hypothetical protein n=1 Tax=Sulfitobacter sp. PR48 TaxID=3028383 RepID=UPI00237C4A4F|nr:hypothetical protein [Sulfitobacter sp. PR48]MDD9722354.1 hypothetical protein [Sulfitobacter sp. PR48]